MSTLPPSASNQTAELGWQRLQRASEIQRGRLNLEDIRRLDRSKEAQNSASQSSRVAANEKGHQRPLSGAAPQLQNMLPRRDTEGVGVGYSVVEDSLLFAQLVNRKQEHEGEGGSSTFSMQLARLSASETSTGTPAELAEALAPYFKNTGKCALDVLIQLPRLGNIRVSATIDENDTLSMSLAPEEEQCLQQLISKQAEYSEGISERLGYQVDLTILASEVSR